MTLVAAGVLALLMFRSAAPIPKGPPEVDLSNASDSTKALIGTARDAVLRSTDSASAWGRLGVILLANELDPDAVTCFQQAVILAPDEYRWTYYLGLAVTALDRPLAISSFRKACELRPNDPIGHARLGELLLAAGDLEGAGRHLEMSIRKNSSPDPRPLQALARVRLLEGKPEEARRLAEQANALAPDSRMVLEVLAQALDRLGEKESVKTLLQRVHSLPDRPLPWRDPYAEQALAMRSDSSATVDEAIRLSEAGNLTAAVELLSAALEKSPGEVQLSLTLAQVYVRSDKLAEALRVLKAAQAAAPQNAEICFRIGVVRYLREEFAVAVDAFTQAIQLKPDHWMALTNLGHCYQQLKDPGAAIHAFQQALQIAPENHNARINLAKILLQTGQQDQAKQHLQKVLEHSPENREAVELLRQLRGE
jgi:tetratricopeptide (TPR) repeat protein